MKLWTYVQELLINLAPSFIASTLGWLVNAMRKVQQKKSLNKEDALDYAIEGLFCIPFGTLFGYIAKGFTQNEPILFGCAALGGALGIKLWDRLAKKVDTIEISDVADIINDPLSILDENEDDLTPKTEMTNSARKYFLGVGVRFLDPTAYNGQDGRLLGPKKDVEDMAAMYKSQGYSINTLIDKTALRQNVRDLMLDYNLMLRKGDKLTLYYSGHGNQITKANGKKLETYCLHDGQMADFELLNLIAALPSGVEVDLILDCCHSGGFDRKSLNMSGRIAKAFKGFTTAEQIAEIERNIKAQSIGMKGGQTVRFLMACQKKEQAFDAINEDGNALFTDSLLKSLKSNASVSYAALIDSAIKQCDTLQTPRIVMRPKGISLDTIVFN